MLRWAVIVLVLANAGYFAWTQGYLGGLGLAPIEQREPQRLAQQLRPEALRLLNGPKGTPADTATAPEPETAAPPPALPAPAVEAAPTPPAAPTPAPPTAAAPASDGPRACWQAAGFTEAQAELLRAELALLGLTANGWQLNETRSSGRWIVYMGRYDNTEQVERKKAELRGLGVQFRELTANGLAPGLALGTYSTEAAARQALQQTERDGVRTARVAQERAESVSFALRLPAITDAQRAAVEGLREAMAGKALRRCG
ncbi:SPOR domain-containing protein [Hydrogenophaga sp. ANAO-22]|jgi:cell division protein FtsN|uniref:SPOR domain-containing protein n=1 Tax=Hydrogenophaga sp. ANAO-22 TaxID=3166645 RepID=UPI0036D36649